MMAQLPGLGQFRRDKSAAVIASIVMGIVLAALPFLIGSGLGNSWLRIVDFAMLYIMLALGLNIVVGFAGLLDLGYIAFYAVGAYLYALLASPQFGLHYPVWLIIPAGAALAGFFGALLGAPTLRLRGDYLAIVTLGFGEIVRIFLNNLNAPINITNGPQGISGIDPLHFGGVTLAKPISFLGFTIPSLHAYYYLFLGLALFIVFVTIRPRSRTRPCGSICSTRDPSALRCGARHSPANLRPTKRHRQHMAKR